MMKLKEMFSLRGFVMSVYLRFIQINQMVILSMAIALFAACPGDTETNNDNNSGTVDRTSLEAAITEAKILLDSVTVSANGAGLAAGTKYVTDQTVKDALADAIAAAQAVYDNAEASQQEVNTAKNDLDSAKAIFEGAIVTKPGELVQFNAPDAAYDGTGIVTGFDAAGERFLLFPQIINVLTDNVIVEAKVKVKGTSGHNGVGFSILTVQQEPVIYR
jgi:hypothetical protein